MVKTISICGGGPAGLALARSLSGKGLDICVIERQNHESLSSPPPDGREIALTHRSMAALKELGAWNRIPGDEAYPLAEAQVFDGQSPLALAFDPQGGKAARLGSLVSNHHIRRSLFESVSERSDIHLMTGRSVTGVVTDNRSARVTLDDGQVLDSDLVVAADSRFSAVRGMLGIPARMHRLGKSMLVGRVAIETDHGHVATEWFDHGQTLALLPLGPGQASAVVTLADGEAERLATLSPEAQGAELTRRYHGRFGAMTMAGPLHRYPLTTAYAQHFAGTRAALVGDAAVGMHPVTAHGFNLGLASTQRLSKLVTSALRRSGDPGSAMMLRRYEMGHRTESWPLYRATNMIVSLYTDDRPVSRTLRKAGLRAARIPMARRLVSRLLMQEA